MKKSRVSKRKIAKTAPLIRLVQIPNARDLDGEPRVALEVPQPGALSRRPLLLMFGSVAAALASKREMEGSH